MKGKLLSLLATTCLLSTSQAFSAVAFWDTLNEQRATITSSKHYHSTRTSWDTPKKSRIKYRPKPYSTTKRALNCHVKQAARLPNQCVKQDRHTRKGILNQINYLKKPSSKKAVRQLRHNKYHVNHKKLLGTAKKLLSWHDGKNQKSLASRFSLRELDTRTGKVKYTGYFTPFISARKHPNSEYKYPIYKTPKGYLPSRSAVFQGALRGKNLEIAWTNDPISYYFAQIQGSGVLSYVDGRITSLHYDKKTKRDYVSVATHMYNEGYISRPSEKEMRRWLKRNPREIERILSVNPIFVFFREEAKQSTRKTASGSTLIAGHSVAVDTDYIPFGSILLAEIPLRNSSGKIIDREWRLLFAQDRGSAIQGANRLDLYTGEGKKAKRETRKVTGVGRAYLLMKKG